MSSWASAMSQLGPEIAVMVTLVWVMLSDLFLSRRPRGLWTQTLLGLAGAAFVAALGIYAGVSAAPLHPAIDSVLALTPMTSLLKAAVLTLAALSVAVAHGSFEETRRHAGEFYALLLFATLGALLCISSQDLLLFFVSFELLSLPLYMLCAFRRYNSASAEAGLKYFVNGALSSAFLLYGISWIYGAVGTTHLPTLTMRYSLLDSAPHGLLVGCLMVLLGLAFKISAAPFHHWAPDVYSGAPPSVSVFLSTVPKVAMIGFALQLFWGYLDTSGGFFHLSTDWVLLFIILSVVSMFVGNLTALPQTDLRKILAYSGIAQVGYLCLGLAACSEVNPNPHRALTGVLFYAIVYGLSNLGAWAVVAWVGRRQQRLDLNSLRGLHQRSPILAACLALCLMSLAGVPPLSGFVGKFYIFRSIYDSKLPFLVVLGILNSVISLFYYFRVLKAAYFVEPGESDPTPVAVRAVPRLAFHLCLWSNLVLGLWPGLIQVVEGVTASLS